MARSKKDDIDYADYKDGLVGSGLVHNPSETIPDPPPTYGTHMYVMPLDGDITGPCVACRYSMDAEHHITTQQIQEEAIKWYVNAHKEEAPEVQQKEIHEEAADIVYGDREQTYDDPNKNFRKIARMWSGMLDKKLLRPITPQDVALMFILLKISRESFQPKRDNRVDIIGYTLCLQRIMVREEYEAREEAEWNNDAE
jgi:hypothetical protein